MTTLLDSDYTEKEQKSGSRADGSADDEVAGEELQMERRSSEDDIKLMFIGMTRNLGKRGSRIARNRKV